MNTLTTLTLAASERQFVTVEVPTGMTAAEAQHRLETWERLRDAVEVVMHAIPAGKYWEPGGIEAIEARRVGRAALAAADRETT